MTGVAQWEPQFDACSSDQEQLALKFCLEIAGEHGGQGSLPDPVRLLEMAEALYVAERDECGPDAGRQWQPIATAPEGEPVLVYLEPIDAIDLAHRTDAGRWVSGGGTVWPEGVCTKWQPLPDTPRTSEGTKA